jgi:hypothetical protein
VADLNGDWRDVTDRCEAGVIPDSLVQLCSQRNGRTLVEFRLSR